MYQEVFLEKIFNFITSLGRKGSKEERQRKVDAMVATLPNEERLTSPIWRIQNGMFIRFNLTTSSFLIGIDLDPHRDTPVEILHVVLLGFVKYFWRDAMGRLSDEQKEVLVARLSSLDTSGLNIPPIAARTFVRYAGSLVGRDFRVIAQVAPFVLFDLVPQACYDAWLALSTLIPLIWQPVIDDLNEYLVSSCIVSNICNRVLMRGNRSTSPRV